MSVGFLEETRASAIPDSLAIANLTWHAGDEAVELMIEGAIAQLGGHAQQYATLPVQRLQRRYAHMRAGAWFAWGTTIEGDRGSVAYAKPVQPRQYFDDGKLKTIKYETAPKCEALPLLPFVDAATAAKIFQRYRVKPRDGETFWQTVARDKRIPIGITEGLKKALAMTAHGIPTIALRGVTTWHPKGQPELHQAIAALATRDGHFARKVYIAFDQDAKPKTVRDVRRQAIRLGEALELAGSNPRYLAWDMGEGKGIDDAIARQPQGDRQQWFDGVVAAAATLRQHKAVGMRAAALGSIQALSRLSFPAERATEGEYLPELPALQPGAIHALSADMNAGKTTRIGADWVSWARQQGWHVLVLSPRNNLGTQTAKDWGLPHVNETPIPSELWGRVKDRRGVVMCPDSLLKIPQWFWESPILLVLDEANQVIKHAAEGDTLGARYDRTLYEFGEAIQRAIASGAIVLSEAKLPDRAVNFVRAIAGEAAPVRVFTHEKQGTPWACTVWKGQASGFRARLLQALGEGKHLITTSSAAEGRRMERSIAKRYPRLKAVRIDGTTNQDGQFRAFFESPEQWLREQKPDVLILSPSAESGVSIEGGVSATDAYFGKVWGYFPILATDSHMQLLGRYRPPVPREIFCPKFITTGGDEGILNPYGIRRRWQANTRAIARVHGLAALLDESRDDLALRTEGAIADYLADARAVAGAQKAIAHEALMQALEDAGHVVSQGEAKKHQPTIDLWAEAQEELWREDAEAIAAAELTGRHTLDWARETLDSMDATAGDRTIAHKALWRDEFPGVAFDDPEECYEALVKDYGKMRRGVLLQSRAEHLDATKHAEAPAAQAVLSGKVRSPHRLPKNYTRAWLLQRTGVLGLLDGATYGNRSPRAIAVKRNALYYASEIRYWLRLNIKATQTPVEICNKLLAKIGIDKDCGLKVSRPGARGEQGGRIYRVDLAANPVRARLLESARRKASEAVSTICNKDQLPLKQIVDTPPNPPPDPAIALGLRTWWAAASDAAEKQAVLDEAIAQGLPPNPEEWRAIAA